MGCGRFTPFDLDKTLCADSLVATARVVDVGWIVEETDGTFDGALVYCGR